MWWEALPRLPVHPTKELLAMSAILITTVPLHGHVLPALSIARELTARGHEVRWYTGRVRPQVEAAGATYVPMTPGLGEHSLDEVRGRPGAAGAEPPPVRPRPRAPAHPPEPGVHRGHPRSAAGRARQPGPRPQLFFAAGLVHELGGPPWAAYGITAVQGRRGPADRQQERTVRSLQIYTVQVTPATGGRGRSKTC